MKNKKSHSGETLIEVMMAITVLIIVMAPAAELNVKAIRNSAYNRDHLIAETLANEGLEIVRGIRDTNLLRFSTKKELCWKTKPEYTGGIDGCEKDLIGSGSYIIKETIGSPNTGLVWKAGAQLSDDFNPADDSVYRLKLDSVTNTYNSDADSPTNFYTNFYREVYLEYSQSEKTMFISSRVFFKNGGKVKKVTRITALTPKTE